MCKRGKTPSRANVLAQIKQDEHARVDPRAPIKFDSKGDLIGQRKFYLFKINARASTS